MKNTQNAIDCWNFNKKCNGCWAISKPESRDKLSLYNLNCLLVKSPILAIAPLAKNMVMQ